jgi:hypothetical protein
MVAADFGTAGSREITLGLLAKDGHEAGIQSRLHFRVQYEYGNRHFFFLLYIAI